MANRMQQPLLTATALPRVQKKAAMCSERFLNQQEKDAVGDAVMNDGSPKRLDSKKRDLELSTFMLKKENVLKEDSTTK